jgi:hypothetical protein
MEMVVAYLSAVSFCMAFFSVSIISFRAYVGRSFLVNSGKMEPLSDRHMEIISVLVVLVLIPLSILVSLFINAFYFALITSVVVASGCLYLFKIRLLFIEKIDFKYIFPVIRFSRPFDKLLTPHLLLIVGIVSFALYRMLV